MTTMISEAEYEKAAKADAMHRARRERNIGRYEIRCYWCGKVLKYTDNVPRAAHCKECGCSSFDYELVLRGAR